jgi:NAD(P)H-flavin reductase
MTGQDLVTTLSSEAMTPTPYRVVSKETETGDTFTLLLEGSNGREIDFAPGQFMMIYVFGVGEVPISIAGNPRQGHTLVHTVRGVGPVTNALCRLTPGDVIGVRGPYGAAWPIDEARECDLVIIAGGIGMAPLRPSVLEGMARREEFRSVSLLYGARTPEDLLYKSDLLGWESSPDVNVEITVDRASFDWRGDVGLVTALIPRIDFDPPSTRAFVCGPEVMMRVVARDLADRGVEKSNIYISLERNMKCAVGFCGHCQYGADFLCKTGPVGPYGRFEPRLGLDEL